MTVLKFDPNVGKVYFLSKSAEQFVIDFCRCKLQKIQSRKRRVHYDASFLGVAIASFERKSL